MRSTPLHFAVLHGHAQVARYFIGQGANVHTTQTTTGPLNRIREYGGLLGPPSDATAKPTTDHLGAARMSRSLDDSRTVAASGKKEEDKKAKEVLQEDRGEEDLNRRTCVGKSVLDMAHIFLENALPHAAQDSAQGKASHGGLASPTTPSSEALFSMSDENPKQVPGGADHGSIASHTDRPDSVSTDIVYQMQMLIAMLVEPPPPS